MELCYVTSIVVYVIACACLAVTSLGVKVSVTMAGIHATTP